MIILNNNLSFIKDLIVSNEMDVNKIDINFNGWTLLFYACILDTNEMIKFLINFACYIFIVDYNNKQHLIMQKNVVIMIYHNYYIIKSKVIN